MDNPFRRLTLDSYIYPFDCGDEDLNDFLFNDAKPYLFELLAVTYLLEKEDHTVGYFNLINDKISSNEFGSSKWSKAKKRLPKSKHRKDYPAVKIGRLAVDLRYRELGLHIGQSILDFIKKWMLESNKTGCRFITVDAYFSAVEFYKKNGFQVMRGEDEKKWLKAKEEVEKQIKFNEKHHIETKAKWPEETLSMWFDLTLLTKKESMEF